MKTLLERIAEHVEEPYFFQALVSEIDQIEKPIDRAKLRLELLSYVVPKVKNVDAEANDAKAPVSVTFQEIPGAK